MYVIPAKAGIQVPLFITPLVNLPCATKDIGNRLTNNIGNTSPMGIAGMGGGKGDLAPRAVGAFN